MTFIGTGANQWIRRPGTRTPQVATKVGKMWESWRQWMPWRIGSCPLLPRCRAASLRSCLEEKLMSPPRPPAYRLLVTAGHEDLSSFLLSTKFKALQSTNRSFWYSFQINKTAFQTKIVPLLESAQLEGAGMFLSITQGTQKCLSPSSRGVRTRGRCAFRRHWCVEIYFHLEIRKKVFKVVAVPFHFQSLLSANLN